MSLALLAGLALAVSPAHVTLVAPASRAVDVRNTGSLGATIDVKSPAAQWVQIRPKRLVLRAGSHGLLTVRARADARARPGDHELVLLLLARPMQTTRIAVRLRLGLRVRVRLPGKLRRRIALLGLQVRRERHGRTFLISLANAGNVTEQLRGQLKLALVHSGRLVSRLCYRGNRELFPGARAVVALPYSGRARGLVTAIVKVPTAERRYRLRL